MSAGITVDVSEFQSALKEYLTLTSKDMVTALNGKAKDLALRSAQNTPKTKMTATQFAKQQTDPELVAARARAIYERRGGFNSGVGFGQIYRATKQTMANKRLNKGFMRSAFVHAGNKYKQTGDASKAKPQRVEYVGKNAKASISPASRNSMAALFDCQWTATGPTDAAQKQAIVSPAIAKAIYVVTADMRKYILRKYEQRAKRISAQTARAVAGVFR